MEMDGMEDFWRLAKRSNFAANLKVREPLENLMWVKLVWLVIFFLKKKKLKKKKSNWANIGCKNEEVKFQTVTHSQGNEVMWEVLGTECKVESMGNDATDEQMCCLAQQTYEVQCKDASGSNFVQWSSQNFHFFWITINPTHRVNQEKKTRFILLRWSLGGWKYVNHWGQNILYRFWSQQQRRIWSRKRRKNQ